jgi:AcrR family transcriptional regulator
MLGRSSRVPALSGLTIQRSGSLSRPRQTLDHLSTNDCASPLVGMRSASTGSSPRPAWPKATFYHHFPAKDDLVRAYGEKQSQARRATAARLPQAAPRDMVLATFDSIGELGRDPSYRGCPFVNAAAEYPDPVHPVRHDIAEHRRWFRELLRNLLIADGHPDAERTADILVALKDGLLVGSDLDDPARRSLIRDAVIRLLGGAAPIEAAAPGS